MLTASQNRTTLKDLANRLGVSKTIVSKVVNNHPEVRVGKELRQKILETAQKLDYTPLRSAQALTTKKTGQIAFLLSAKTTLGLANSYYGRILAGVNESCRRRGYQCIVDVYDLSNIEDFIFPNNIRTRNIDGCIILGLLNDLVMEKFTTVDIPTVAIGGRADRTTVPVITSDLESFLKQMFAYVKNIGHRKIWLGFGNASTNTREIVEDTIRKYDDMDATLVANSCGHDNAGEFEYGQKTAEQWLSLPIKQRPTLVFGADQWCVSFSSTIQRAGYKCPEDISIIAGCDSSLVQWHSPPITTYSNIKCYQYGLRGATLLFDILESKVKYSDAFQVAAEIKISAELIERDSVINLSNCG